MEFNTGTPATEILPTMKDVELRVNCRIWKRGEEDECSRNPAVFYDGQDDSSTRYGRKIEICEVDRVFCVVVRRWKIVKFVRVWREGRRRRIWKRILRAGRRIYRVIFDFSVAVYFIIQC